jgi:DNA-binding beta-propeller fold protein YncE
MIADIAVPGRTRWAVYHAQQDAFFVNIADPAQIVVVETADPKRIASTYPIPTIGPHGLDLDIERDRLFCACDGRKLIILDAGTGGVLAERDLGGMPDVIFFNAVLQHLYVAIGDSGVIEVFDTDTLEHIETVLTEKGAHTIGFDPDRHKVYAFLPQTHCAAVYRDRGQ